jgi:hypothetical protein
MGKLPEPDDVDIFVGGGDPDPESIRETVEYIKEYKKRPEYAEEVREARRILDSLKIDAQAYGMPDPAALLDHWKRCVEDLTPCDTSGQANARHSTEVEPPSQ